jgi:hypothetical protein
LAAPEQRCRNLVLVYIDLSETMTGLPGNDRSVPLYKIAGMIRMLLTDRSNLLRDGDALAIIAFGHHVQPLYASERISETERARLNAELDILTSSQWRDAPIVHNAIGNLREFHLTTDFGPVFADIATRLQTSQFDRKIVIIASDFAHDPDNSCSASEHSRDFAQKFEAFATPPVQNRFAPSDDAIPSAQLMLLRVPAEVSKRCKTADLEVSTGVIKSLRVLKPHEIEDVSARTAEDLGGRIEDEFSARVRIQNPRKASSDAIAFEIENPNCSNVRISNVQVGIDGHSISVPLSQPQTLGRLEVSKTLMIQSPKLEVFDDHFVDISPAIAGVKTVSTKFWMGDTLRLDRLTPRLFPRFVGSGRVLLEVDVSVNAQKERKFRITLKPIEPGQGRWSNEFTVDPSGRQSERRIYLIPFEAPSRKIDSLREQDGIGVEVTPQNGGVVVSQTGAGSRKTGEARRNLDGWIKEYFPPFAATVFFLLLLHGRWHKVTFGESLAFSSNLNSVVTSAAALLAFGISLTNVGAVPGYGGLQAGAWMPSVAMAFAEALAIGFVSVFVGRTFVLGVYWPLLLRSNSDVEWAHDRRIRMEKWIVRGSAVLSITVFLVFIYYNTTTAVLVMTEPS